MPLYRADISKILFLDIETVSQSAAFDDLSAEWQELWDDKTQYQRGEEESPADFYARRAAVLAEFGKVICISCGFFAGQGQQRQFRVRSFYGHDEARLLGDFAHLLSSHFSRHLLCAHNGKEFDFPYLARRMAVHGLKIPDSLNTSGLKPWEVPHLDTLEMWKFGDRKNFTSLRLLAALFDIPTPKDDIDGSQVGEVYWQQDDLERIVEYCQKDTATVARLLLRLEQLPPLKDDEIVVNNE